MAKPISKWLPPDVHSILVENIPEGAQWYEVRNPWQYKSYTINEYDRALRTVRTLKKSMRSIAMYYVWLESGSFQEERIY